MRVDQCAPDTLLEELKEQTCEELAFALAGETDDVLVRGDTALIEPERPT